MPRILHSERSIFIRALTFALGCALSCISVLAAAEPRAFEIVAGDATDTLKEFARQAELQTLFDYRLVRNMRTRAVSGAFEADDALKQMLTGTGLRFERVNERTVAIRSGQDGEKSGTPESSAAVDLEPGRDEALRLAQADTAVPTQQGQGTTAAESPLEALEEITVTAQKRVERLTDVPISISVLDGKDLDKSTVQGVSEALTMVPGVAATTTRQGSTLLTVRGVAAADGTFFGSNPIAYYLDSMPFGLVKSAIVPDSSAYDMERIEVLRGPQGTLYGANAMNGVVRVLTHDPDPGQFEFKARASVSSTQDGGENYRGDAAVNVPIIADKLAVRAVVGYQDLSGWIDKPNEEDANDVQVRNFRLKIGGQLTERFSVGASGWFSRSDADAPPQAHDPLQSDAPDPEPQATDYDAYNLKLGYDFGAFSLTSMTSNLDYRNPSDLAVFGIVLFQELGSHVFSQEIVMNSGPSDSWRWSLGGIYRDGEDHLTELFRGFPPSYEWIDSSESFAVFGELTRVFLDGRFELTGGLRYFEDEVDSREGTVGAAPDLVTDAKFDALTPRVVLNWHPNRQTTFYGSYSEGFRSGFDQFKTAKALLNLPPIKPDELTNYELGAKGGLWDRRLSYEAAVYYIDWQDVQQSIGVFVPGDNVPKAANINGDSASGMGFEVALGTQPVDGLNLGVTFGWNDLASDAVVLSAGTALFNRGDRLVHSPKYTAGVVAEYAFPLGGYNGRLSASGSYVSAQDSRSVLTDAGNSVLDLARGGALLVTRASFSVEAFERWSATLFADNIGNEQDISLPGSSLIPQFADLSGRIRPRTVGLQLEYRF